MDHIYKHVSDNSKKCLSVGNSGILSVIVVVVCVLAPAYTSLCRGLEYLLKVRYIILVDPLRSKRRIFDFRDRFSGQVVCKYLWLRQSSLYSTRLFTFWFENF